MWPVTGIQVHNFT